MELAIMNKSWHNNDNIMNSEAVSQPAPLYRRILWSMPFRVLFGLGVPAAALAGLWFLYRFGNPFPCVFHKLTGLYCPGCGRGGRCPRCCICIWWTPSITMCFLSWRCPWPRIIC